MEIPRSLAMRAAFTMLTSRPPESDIDAVRPFTRAAKRGRVLEIEASSPS